MLMGVSLDAAIHWGRLLESKRELSRGWTRLLKETCGNAWEADRSGTWPQRCRRPPKPATLYSACHVSSRSQERLSELSDKTQEDTEGTWAEPRCRFGQCLLPLLTRIIFKKIIRSGYSNRYLCLFFNTVRPLLRALYCHYCIILSKLTSFIYFIRCYFSPQYYNSAPS